MAAKGNGRSTLPDGVDDSELNRGQLARAFNVSENTLDRWVADGMPVLEVGANGRPYRFQLSSCWGWKTDRDVEETRAQDEAERSVQQMRLALIGGRVGTSEQSLSPKERAALYAAEQGYMQAARARRDLIPFDEVVDLIEDVLAIVRDGITALPDRLARECGLEGRQTEKAIVAGDDLIGELNRKIREARLEGRTASSGQPANGHLELQ